MKNQAFSLVELSIVLVILGLLTGGVLTGQSLIRAAELRSVATEFDQYQTAVNTFKGKYFQLPGDMTNAEDFWGTMATGTCPAATGGTGTQTCDGNGDGTIDNAGDADETGEALMFWKQLANAGMISGTFTGIAGDGAGRHFIANENVPASKLSGAVWGLDSQAFPNTNNRYTVSYGNTFEFGALETDGDSDAGILAPEEAWNIDTKIDDGKPGRGKVLAMNLNLGGAANARCTDAANNTDLDSDYTLSDEDPECALIFNKPF